MPGAQRAAPLASRRTWSSSARVPARDRRVVDMPGRTTSSATLDPSASTPPFRQGPGSSAVRLRRDPGRRRCRRTRPTSRRLDPMLVTMAVMKASTSLNGGRAPTARNTHSPAGASCSPAAAHDLPLQLADPGRVTAGRPRSSPASTPSRLTQFRRVSPPLTRAAGRSDDTPSRPAEPTRRRPGPSPRETRARNPGILPSVQAQRHPPGEIKPSTLPGAIQTGAAASQSGHLTRAPGRSGRAHEDHQRTCNGRPRTAATR